MYIYITIYIIYIIYIVKVIVNLFSAISLNCNRHRHHFNRTDPMILKRFLRKFSKILL